MNLTFCKWKSGSYHYFYSDLILDEREKTTVHLEIWWRMTVHILCLDYPDLIRSPGPTLLCFSGFYMSWWHLKSSARLCLQLKIKGWLALGQQKFCFSFLVFEQANQLRDILWHHVIISQCFGVISFKILLECIAHWSNHKEKKTSHTNVREDVCLSLYISLVKHQELKKAPQITDHLNCYLVCGVAVPNNEFAILGSTDQKPGEKKEEINKGKDCHQFELAECDAYVYI